MTEETTFSLSKQQAKLSSEILGVFSGIYSVNESRKFQVSTSYEFSSSSGIGTNVYLIVKVSEENKPGIVIRYDLTEYDRW